MQQLWCLEELYTESVQGVWVGVGVPASFTVVCQYLHTYAHEQALLCRCCMAANQTRQDEGICG